MKPTDEDLNRRMAEACGWVIYGDTAKSPTGSSNAMEANGRQIEPWPDYCRDRNALEEGWKEIGNCMVIPQFLTILKPFVDTAPANVWDAWSAWDVMTAPLRLQVIAALKALGKWTEEWDAE